MENLDNIIGENKVSDYDGKLEANRAAYDAKFQTNNSKVFSERMEDNNWGNGAYLDEKNDAYALHCIYDAARNSGDKRLYDLIELLMNSPADTPEKRDKLIDTINNTLTEVLNDNTLKGEDYTDIKRVVDEKHFIKGLTQEQLVQIKKKKMESRAKIRAFEEKEAIKAQKAAKLKEFKDIMHDNKWKTEYDEFLEDIFNAYFETVTKDGSILDEAMDILKGRKIDTEYPITSRNRILEDFLVKIQELGEPAENARLSITHAIIPLRTSSRDEEKKEKDKINMAKWKDANKATNEKISNLRGEFDLDDNVKPKKLNNLDSLLYENLEAGAQNKTETVTIAENLVEENKRIEKQKDKRLENRQKFLVEYNDTATNEEKTERIVDIYNGLSTLERRLEYIVGLYSHRSIQMGIGEWKNSDNDALNSVWNSFIEEYLADGNEINIRRVFEHLGRLDTSNSIDLSIDREKYLEHVSEDDPKRFEKADYLTRTCSNYGVEADSINSLITSVTSRYMPNGQQDENKKNNIDKWLRNGRDDVLESKEIYSKQQKNIFDTIRTSYKDDFAMEGIENWANSALTINFIQQQKVNKTTTDSKYFFNKFVKNHVTHKKLSAKAINRKNMPFNQKFGNLINAEDEVSASDCATLKYDLNVDINPKVKEKLLTHISLFNDGKNGDVFLKCWGINRITSAMSVYKIWVMANYPDMDLNQILLADENPELREKFINFCKNTPVASAKTREEYIENVKKWMDVFKKSSDRMKEFKFPKTDFNNPNSINETLFAQSKIKELVIDFSQEKDRILSPKFDVDGRIVAEDYLAEKYPDEENPYGEMVDFWGALQGYYATYSSSYVTYSGLNGDNSVDGVWNGLSTLAVSRVLNDMVFTGQAGHAFQTGARRLGERQFYWPALVADITLGTARIFADGELTDEYKKYGPISQKEMLEYLSGANKKPFEDKIKKIIKAIEPSYRKTKMINIAGEAAVQFRNNIKFGNIYEKVANLPDDVDSTMAFFTSNDPVVGVKSEDISNKHWVDLTMKNLFTETYRQQIASAGMKEMDVILINGQTPKQLWGNKYANVDKYTKDRCYQLEVLKAIAKGESNISVKAFALGKDNVMQPVKEICVIKPKLELQDIKKNYEVYLKGIQSIKSQLTQIQNVLLTTHENKDIQVARGEIGRVGSGYYKKMEKTLDDAIKALDNHELTPLQVEKALREYKTAASTYYRERKSIFKKRHQEGTDRLNQSEIGSKLMPELIIYYQDLVRGVSNDMAVNYYENMTNCNIRKWDVMINSSLSDDERVGKATKLGEFNVDEAQVTNIADSKKVISKAKNELKDAIAAGVKAMGKNYGDLLKEYKAKGKANSYNMALLYIFNDYLERIDDKNITKDEVDQLKAGINEKFQDGTYVRKATELSRNSVFCALLKTNKRNFHTEWAAIEKKSDEYTLEMQNDINAFDAPDKIGKYILTGNMEGGEIPHGAGALDEKYERLGEFIAKKMLADPRNRIIVQAISSDKMTFDEVKKLTTQTMKRQGVLEDVNLTFDVLGQRVNNNNLVNMVVESAVNLSNKNAKERLESKHIDREIAAVQGPRNYAPAGPQPH